MMNSQEAHFIKHFLRFKGKENPQRLVQPWSRVALVIDTDISDLKFLLEITEKGFQTYEFLSRMLYYKKDPEKVVASMISLQPVISE